jgi:hypothetical protein
VEPTWLGSGSRGVCGVELVGELVMVMVMGGITGEPWWGLVVVLMPKQSGLGLRY